MTALRWLAVVSGSAAILTGTYHAFWRAWICDDAYITFRYARNLVEGHGLVFNAGERVEGYTNFLWTLWCAAGLSLGSSAEAWSIVWGVMAYVGSIALLVVHHRILRRGGEVPLTICVAALMAALHPDWAIYATCGLETSALTFLALAGYLLLTSGETCAWRQAASGLVFATATLTRPDAILLAGVGGLYLIWRGRPRWIAVARYLAVFAVVYVPPTLWRVWYYGSFFPNTYYAKSAYLPWWDQGLAYVGLYFERYWVLLLGPALLVVSILVRLSGRRPAGPLVSPAAWLALGFTLVHTLYVARIGGDFMYARMLIPVTPFLMILFERGLCVLPASRRITCLSLSLVAVVVVAVMPPPVTDTVRRHGVVNEWMYYRQARLDDWYERAASVLERYLADLPARVAFLGSEARLMYAARIPVAVEAETGLTDPFIARQELTRRGRVGHEKTAPLDYLVGQRKVHFVFQPLAPEVLKMADSLPAWEVRFDELQGWLLHWDGALMAELRSRGASFKDFPMELDRLIASLDDLDDEAAAILYEKLKLFYFVHAEDPLREARFLERLGRGGRGKG